MRIPQNIYRQAVGDVDNDLLEIRVPEDPYLYADAPLVRVETQAQSTSSRPVFLTIKQAEEAYEALGEAIFAARLLIETQEV